MATETSGTIDVETGLGSTAATDASFGAPHRSRVVLATFAASAALLIPLAWWIPGLLAWAACATLVVRSGDRVLRERMTPLLLVVLLLAAVPIGTGLSNANFLRLGAAFAAAVVLPWAMLRRRHPGVIEYQVFPQRWSMVETAYVVLSIPLAWAVVQFYFFHLTPSMPWQWPVRADSSSGDVWRLFAGINGVGIWDELFFINTVYAVLRSLYPARLANWTQAVVYTSVLNDMAFVGAGPVIVYAFAWLQGIMYERTRKLLYVLLVHLIVDAFLIAAILHAHRPASVPIRF